jgi:hypothetical protein
MTVRVVVSSWAIWDREAVWLNGVRVADAAWREAPALSALHPKARRPPDEAAQWVQLCHLLLSGRRAGADRPLHRSELEIRVGTSRGSAAADRNFLRGVEERGSGFGSPSQFVYTLSTAAPAEAALAFGLRGGLSTVAAGTASGLTAVVGAVSRIEAGQAPACLCGGAEFDQGLDHLALFLLERADPADPLLQHCVALTDGQTGWAPAAEPSHTTAEKIEPLLRLAEALAAVEREEPPLAPRSVYHRASQGHWASIRVSGCR